MKDFNTLIKMIKQETYVMNKKQRRLSIALFIIVFIGSLMELLGVTAILPFIQSMLDVDSLSQNWYMRRIIEFLHLDNQLQVIFTVAILVVLVYIFKNFYLLFSINMQYRFKYTFQRELSSRMLSAYMRRPYEFFLDVNSAQILRSINEDVVAVYAIYDNFFKMLSEMLNIVLIGIFLICTDWMMAAGVLILFSICLIVITYVFRNLLRNVGEKYREGVMRSHKYAYQSVGGIKEIHVMKKNEYFVRQYDEAYLLRSKMERKQAFIGACPEKIIEMSCITGIIGVICVRLLIGVDMQNFVSSLSVFAVAAFRILPAISRTLGYISMIIYQRPALEDLYGQLLEVEKYEKEVKVYIENSSCIKERKESIFNDKIEVRNIFWKYPNSEVLVLNNLNLTICKGDAVGLIGSSGSGKTTLSDMLLGLFRPLSGGIFVDGVNIFTIPKEWAQVVGYVPQSVYLTDDTIRNNIAFGEDEKDIDDERIWKSLEEAQFKEFVQKLPDGLDTLVGERGIRFSGGQKQRIAIARALYYNPSIVVLDEATSALDNETEKAVMESIDALQKQKTLIIVAHRLTTLKNCNKVFEIKDGKAFEVDVEQLRREL